MIYFNDLKKFLIQNFNNEVYLLNENYYDNKHLINSFIELDINNKNCNALMWINFKNKEKIKEINNGIIIAPNVDSSYFDKNFNGVYIVCDNPRYVFASCVNFIFGKKNNLIENNFYNYKNVKIGKGTIIEDNVDIGEGTVIGYNNVIYSGTIIGKNCSIVSNNTIGGCGFGYEKNIKTGLLEKIAHIGNVIIKDNVDIGSNNCIDKAVLGSTVISENSKIDNLVHIAHNVKVGKNCTIIANSMVAGSVIISDDSWVAPSSSIKNGIEIKQNSIIGMGSVVIRDVGEGCIVAGVPAKLLRYNK